MRKVLIFIISLYQLILSPLQGGRYCVFTPSCSQYTKEAIEKYGVLKGIWLGCKRILRCNPFQKAAYDPLL